MLLEDRGLGKEALLEAVANLTAEKTHGARYVFLARRQGGLDLGIWLRNGLDRTLSGTLALSKRVAVAEDTQRERPLSLAEGESTLLRFGLSPKMGTSRPIGNLITSFTFSDNKSFAIGERAHLWAACASRFTGERKPKGPSGWSANEMVGYVFASGRLGGGYGTEQVRKGGTWFISAGERRMGLRVFARWSEEELQFAFDMDATMKETAKSIEVMLDPGLTEMLAGRTPSTSPRSITISLSSRSLSFTDLGAPGEPGKQTEELADAMLNVSPSGGGSFVEMTLPARAVLARAPRVGQSIGFNILVEGVNPFSNEQTQMVFSGRPNYLPHDPEGWSQLLFLE